MHIFHIFVSFRILPYLTWSYLIKPDSIYLFLWLLADFQSIPSLIFRVFTLFLVLPWFLSPGETMILPWSQTISWFMWMTGWLIFMKKIHQCCVALRWPPNFLPAPSWQECVEFGAENPLRLNMRSIKRLETWLFCFFRLFVPQLSWSTSFKYLTLFIVVPCNVPSVRFAVLLQLCFDGIQWIPTEVILSVFPTWQDMNVPKGEALFWCVKTCFDRWFSVSIIYLEEVITKYCIEKCDKHKICTAACGGSCSLQLSTDLKQTLKTQTWSNMMISHKTREQLRITFWNSWIWKMVNFWKT